MPKFRFAVVGAGISGCTACKAAKLESSLPPEDVEVTVFERSDCLGGLWVAREQVGTTPCYESLSTNVSKQMMGFSDFPFPEDYPDFPHHRQILSYLNSYVDHFGIRDCFSFGVEVLSATKEGKEWVVVSQSLSGTVTERFDALFVASGKSFPNIPTYEDDAFQGVRLHSMDYKKAEPFCGKNVVVIGYGNSAMDVACEISGVAKNTYMSGRGGYYLNRVADNVPFDWASNRISGKVPLWVIEKVIGKLVMPLGDAPKVFKFGQVRLSPHDAIGPVIESGAVKLRSRATKLKERSVVFADGNEVDADAVIFATGFKREFPYLHPSTPLPDDLLLYKHVFPPGASPSDTTDHTLAVLMLCGVGGASWPIAEIQARWAARVMTGDVTLPPTAELLKEIAAFRADAVRRQVADPLIILNRPGYMDELGQFIGAKPGLLSNFGVCLKALLLGPSLPQQWRLNGKFSTPEEAATVLNDRYAEMQQRKATSKALAQK